MNNTTPNTITALEAPPTTDISGADLPSMDRSFVLQDNITGRFNPTPMTWKQANEAVTDFETIRRLDEAIEECRGVVTS